MLNPFVARQLSDLDRAGAGAEPPSVARRSFLGRGLAAAAAVVGYGASTASAQPPPAVGIRDQFRFIREHENAHVDFLVDFLGAAARPKPNFQNLEQPNLARFVAVSQALENTGVGAYLAATPFIFDQDVVLPAAASIALIEARHAGFLNVYRSRPVTENLRGEEQDFETPLSIEEVVAAADPFIRDLNGGPPLEFSTTRSPENDIDIANFALALEFLEADFYNVNVRKFFRV
jgi:hypothetical protein